MSFSDADLVRAYPRIYAFAVSLLRDKTAAEDLTHDTVVKMLKYASRFTGNLSELVTWGCKIAQNHFRYQRSLLRSKLEVDSSDELDVAGPDNPEARLHLIDTLRRLDRINAKHRNALLMFAQGESYEDIAAAQGFASVVTAKTAVCKARYGLTCEPVTCPQCGVSFIPKDKTQRTCGVVCGGQRGGNATAKSQRFACETVDGVTAWSVRY